MKTQDIRNMALALQAVEEATKKVNKHGHDAVGHEDPDVNNDNKVDSTDKYLLNRRKSISAAIKGKGTKETVTTEEVELDEISSDLANRYLDKSRKSSKKLGDYVDKTRSYGGPEDDKLTNRIRGQRMARQKTHGYAKVAATESFDLSDLTLEELEDFMMSEDFEQLDEISKKTLASYVKKASSDAAGKSGQAEYEAGRAHDATYGDKFPDHGAASRWKTRSDKSSMKATNRLKGIAKATDRLATEDVEELDELSKKTLTSYVKKAAGDAVSKAYRAGDVRDKDSGKNYMKALGRQIGISTATNKLTKEEAAWPVFARIQEKVNQTKGATKPESMEDRFTASDKKMVDGHGGIGKKTPEDYVDDFKIDKNPNQFNAANVKVAPKRHNDQTVGDKTMPKAK